MNKILLSIALMSMLTCMGEPIQITSLDITPILCTDDESLGTIVVTVDGGIPPRTFTLTGPSGVIQSVQEDDPTFTFDPISERGALTLTVSDNSNTPSITSINSIVSPFAEIDVDGNACNDITYSISQVTGDTTTVLATLVGPGGPRAPLTSLSGTFTNLPLGTYTLTLKPSLSAIPACNTATVITFKIVQEPLELLVEQTELSQGGTQAQLVVTAEVEITAASLTGPLPDTENIPATTIDGTVATFGDPLDPLVGGIAGGFYTLSVTTSECTLIKLVTVNFFANAVANRIALANC